MLLYIQYGGDMRKITSIDILFHIMFYIINTMKNHKTMFYTTFAL